MVLRARPPRLPRSRRKSTHHPVSPSTVCVPSLVLFLFAFISPLQSSLLRKVHGHFACRTTFSSLFFHPTFVEVIIDAISTEDDLYNSRYFLFLDKNLCDEA